MFSELISVMFLRGGSCGGESAELALHGKFKQPKKNPHLLKKMNLYKVPETQKLRHFVDTEPCVLLSPKPESCEGNAGVG